ncbi:MAG: hypothetical protein JRE18_07345 [Deltaproteobacteria bacterium]|nr:hypothetical protein [Deltaproteobacteria bacterium]
MSPAGYWPTRSRIECTADGSIRSISRSCGGQLPEFHDVSKSPSIAHIGGSEPGPVPVTGFPRARFTGVLEASVDGG